MKKEFYTTKYDIIFKSVMIKNEEILKKILEVILHIKIDDLIFLDKEINPEHFKGKNRTLYLVVKSGNRTINVELNANKKDVHNYRNAAYLFGLYNKALNKDDEYNELKTKEFISINLSYGMSSLDNEILNIYYLQNETRKFIDNLSIYEINMDLIDKCWYNLSEEDKNNYKYLKMLNLDKKDLNKFCEGDVIMESYKDAVENLNAEEDYKFFISPERDAEMLYKTDLALAREEEKEKITKASAIEFYKNGVDKEIIIKSLNIDETTFNKYIEESK